MFPSLCFRLDPYYFMFVSSVPFFPCPSFTSSSPVERAPDSPIFPPYLLLFWNRNRNATLTPATQSQESLHLLKDGKTRYTSGQTVSSLFQLKDVDNTEAGFFVFPDLGVKVEGEFRLKLDLYEIVG